jgi:uncharacterized protein RhaS with RHS repeats
VALTRSDGKKIRLSYDAVGRLSLVEDELGRRTSYSYDRSGP